MNGYDPRGWVQRHWDWRAATNFLFGGCGAGLLVVAAVALPSPRVAVGAALLLIAAGLGAVWLEIGRKLRAAHVLFNPFTSWMTRESFAAAILFAFGLAYLRWQATWMLAAAALAACAFVFCQARILRASKGIPAWRLPALEPLILASALAEGAGAALLFDARPIALALLAAGVLARAFAWPGYRNALPRGRARALLEPAGKAMVQLGTVAPLALLVASALLPEAAALAGVAAIAAGWRFKFVLVARASYNQGFALPQLPVRGAR
jgi:phenylacetyl-CoA:acceptor oxidoreductase subunit 2